jgi:hypothetical protein
MRFFKKPFRKAKKQDKQENECWYNNINEQKRSKFNAEAADIGGVFPAEISQANWFSSHQT